jgi:RHH-type proline utilization regulon transcriptional repressor/proline dehydrogenase/delta 1-pyrroline-5-carboxylate dehydrogenase
MSLTDPFQRRVRDIGHEIFDRAESAQPRVWQRAWWLERMTRWIDADPQFKTRAFQFVDCLPSLRTPESLAAHLAEYLDPQIVSLPGAFHAWLRCGHLQEVRWGSVRWATQFGATGMARRFIAGHDVRSVTQTLQSLRARHMAFTLDVLGESTTSDAQADRYARVYHEIMDRLTPIAAGWPSVPLIDQDERGPVPRVNLSIKLTGLDPHCDAIDPQRAIRDIGVRLRPLFRRARAAHAQVNIDMESTKHRAITLELFKRVLAEEEFRDWEDVGIVVQAYLKGGERDLADLLEWAAVRGRRFTIRLVKGAYWDAESAAAVRNYKAPPVWTRKWQTDACYERMVRTLLENAHMVRPAFASHNVRSLAFALATAEVLHLPPTVYEVQMLYGMGDPLKSAMVQMGQCVRVYCPYGDLMHGMAYLIRRLLENTSNEGFLKQSFNDRRVHDRLLADPARGGPPSAPLPGRFYQDSDLEDSMTRFKNASLTDFAAPENRQKMQDAIESNREAFGHKYPLFINGRTEVTEEWIASHNPSHARETVGWAASARLADADRAVAAAFKAFPTWRTTAAHRRADFLERAADGLEARRFELAAWMILEVGKPWREADAEVSEAIDHCRFYAEQIQRIDSRPRLRNVPGENNRLVYSPKGVCAVLSPWPFPLAILAGMSAAALAAGNTVVIKPARQASVTAAKLVEILHDAGFPAGTVNFLPGAGPIIGRRLTEHDDVAIVAFTGSAEVGTAILRDGSAVRPRQAFIRKLIVEMGGKNAIIVDDDADLDAAVQAILESAFAYAGQKCSSCSRLIVLDGVHDALCGRLREAVMSLRIGPAEAPAAFVGPVIDQAARDRIESFIDMGKTEGRLLVQAPLPDECGDGWFVPPTILIDVRPEARVAQEEILGPVLTVHRAADFDDALRIANQTRYALTGGVFSRRPSHIERAQSEFAVGNLYVNRKITGSQVDSQPFGGFRLSGTGVKAGSPDYLLHFMDARCITENTFRSGFVPSTPAERAT